MKIHAPPFSEGTDYRRMSVAESGGVYRFQLIKPAIFTFSDAIIPIPKRLSFRVKGKEWLRLEPHRMIIADRYAYNGNSPKRGYHILGHDVWIGTPDLDPLPPLPHDVIFQFSHLFEIPFSLEQANDFYEQVCRQRKTWLTSTYRAALDEFSHEFWGKCQPNTTCHEI